MNDNISALLPFSSPLHLAITGIVLAAVGVAAIYIVAGVLRIFGVNMEELVDRMARNSRYDDQLSAFEANAKFFSDPRSILTMTLFLCYSAIFIGVLALIGGGVWAIYRLF